jgi:hypothetical protein
MQVEMRPDESDAIQSNIAAIPQFVKEYNDHCCQRGDSVHLRDLTASLLNAPLINS